MKELDPRQADAQYKSFPSFADWKSCSIDTNRWNRYVSSLEKRSEISTEQLQRAREIIKRAAAMDTGAIEGLYETDRGFTFTVATMTADWESLLDSKGSEVKKFFTAQLRAYDSVVDLATQSEPISEAAIRALHEQVCEAQETYKAYTEVGLQDLRLPKGEYKHLPNHVIGRDGKPHSYAPVDLTPTEMHRLCQKLRGEDFKKAHPVLQASYAHYAFVLIHPFADGNGRVARALASVFTVRSNSIPLLILQENREQYFESLSSADEGTYQPFVDFIFERAVDSIRLVDESLRAAEAPSIEDAVANLKQLYLTKGGLTHEEVDQIGVRLFELFRNEVARQGESVSIKDIGSFDVTSERINHMPAQPVLRTFIDGQSLRALFQFYTKEPANAKVTHTFVIEVPKDCGRDDDFVIRGISSKEFFEARLTELVPAPTAALQMRLSVFVQRIIATAVKQLLTQATENLKKKSY